MNLEKALSEETHISTDQQVSYSSGFLSLKQNCCKKTWHLDSCFIFSPFSEWWLLSVNFEIAFLVPASRAWRGSCGGRCLALGPRTSTRSRRGPGSGSGSRVRGCLGRAAGTLSPLGGRSGVSRALPMVMPTDFKDEGVHCVGIVNFNLINVLKFTTLLITTTHLTFLNVMS